MIRFLILFSRQGKVRLSKWYVTLPPKERAALTREITAAVLARPPRACSVLEVNDFKVVYRRYASLYFAAAVDAADNELAALEAVHLYVEALDRYFGAVCELDLVFEFHRAHAVLDELVLGGLVVEPSKRAAVRAVQAADAAVEEAKAGNLVEAALGTSDV